MSTPSAATGPAALPAGTPCSGLSSPSSVSLAVQSAFRFTAHRAAGAEGSGRPGPAPRGGRARRSRDPAAPTAPGPRPPPASGVWAAWTCGGRGGGVRRQPVVVSVYRSLMTRGGEHLLTRFGALCLSPPVRRLLGSFLAFLTELLISVLSHVKRLLRFRRRPLVRCVFCGWFLPDVWLDFSFPAQRHSRSRALKSINLALRAALACWKFLNTALVFHLL